MPPKRSKAAAGKAATAAATAPKKRASKLAKENDITADQENEILEAFALFAVTDNPDYSDEKEGVLRTEDVRRCLIALNTPPTSSAELSEILEAVDPEESGFVTYAYFIAVAALKLHAKHNDPEQQNEEVDAAFTLFTRGEGDFITLAHLRRVARELREDVPDKMLRDMIKEATSGGGPVAIHHNSCPKKIPPSNYDRIHSPIPDLSSMALTMSVQYLGFRRLYKSELLSDVVISFGDEKVPAHKVILMGASRKLQALLQDQSVDSIDVSAHEPEVVHAMLRWMYGYSWAGHLNPKKYAQRTFAQKTEFAIKVFLIANEYQIKSLGMAITKYFVDSLSARMINGRPNCPSMYPAAGAEVGEVIKQLLELYRDSKDIDRMLLHGVVDFCSTSNLWRFKKDCDIMKLLETYEPFSARMMRRMQQDEDES
ncbi:EF-hand [Aureobasidium pullulans]|nr:EF-hand [Aureobasidium pullulans]THX67990.1 EF-hand [Aureobasidium pullulans]THY43311.1 EF-hand [Aureobasidium pullulans]TIA69221.1 EF-hand [Aureobasidium pullulans]